MDGDTYKAAIEKVRTGITAQTNQAMVRFKLMIEMSQSGRVFSEWWPKVKSRLTVVYGMAMMPRWLPVMLCCTAIIL